VALGGAVWGCAGVGVMVRGGGGTNCGGVLGWLWGVRGWGCGGVGVMVAGAFGASVLRLWIDPFFLPALATPARSPAPTTVGLVMQCLPSS
jgi:hypothetical protein